MNPFAHTSAARRYREGRFYFHPLVVELIAARWPNSLPFGRAVDVGCGTGMSTRALLPVAAAITGTDLSLEMLSQAEPDPRIEYLQAPAESLPFPDGSIDLLTVCKAFHWFDQPRFLGEAARVLSPDGKLVIYGHGFPGIMQGNPEFEAWFKAEFMARYPNAPRPSTDQGRTVIQYSGFRLEEERFSHVLRLTQEQMTAHLLTWSNVILKVEEGRETAESVGDWLRQEMKLFFLGLERGMEFRGHVWFCER